MARTIIYKSKQQEEKFPWRGEVCKRCGKPNYVGYDLDDRGWALITRGLWNIVCIPCLDELSVREGLDWVKFLKWENGRPCLYPCSSIGWNE